MFASARDHTLRQSLLRSVAGPRHLLIRTIKNMRNNFWFVSVYCWCTIVLWRALTGAGYNEGEVLSDTQGPSVLSRFESAFHLDSRKARVAPGWGLGALRHGRGFSPSHPGMPDIDEEVASDDLIGRLIFGEPSTATVARSTATILDSNPS